jgi:hypothetical protein
VERRRSIILSRFTARRTQSCETAYRAEDFLIDESPQGFSIGIMALSSNASTDADLREARNEIVALLRSHDALFLAGLTEATLAQKHAQIAEAFLRWLSTSGFALEIVALTDGAPGMFEGRWTHNGAAFVGFKQPPAAATREDAAILACAALLRNDWCRARMPAR